MSRYDGWLRGAARNRACGGRAALAVVAAVVVAVAGCGSGGSGGSNDLRFAGSPTIDAGPNGRVPLVRIVNVETTVPTRLEITLSDGAQDSFTVVSADFATSHSQTILGLKPGRTYAVTLAATSGGGGRIEWDQPLDIETAPLPDTFPVLTVQAADTARMEPGFTLFAARSKVGNAADIVIVDGTGDVVWFADLPVSGVVTRLANGHLVTIMGDRTTIQEIDMLGQTVRTWYAARATAVPPANGIAVDCFNFHNDIFPVTSAGTFLVPTAIVRFIDDFPTNENDPSARATVAVRDEPIIEFGQDGVIVQTWNFLDLLKPTRIGFDGTQGLPAEADWAHTNAAILDQRDDSIIASLRHQDAVVKVSRADRQLRWILGPHANWQGFEQFLLDPVGEPFAWSYHQHAPQLTSTGTLLVFDNGDWRASPFTGEPRVPAEANHSRAVEYAVDEDAHTVRQPWEFVHPEQLYSPFVGSAYELQATGNVLVTFGGLCTIGGVHSDDIAHCRGTARIVEVDRGSADAIVFDLGVSDRDPSALGWFVYRSTRIAELDPGGVRAE